MKMPPDHSLLNGDQDDEDIKHFEVGHVEGRTGDAVGDQADLEGPRQVVDPLQRGQIGRLLDELGAAAPGPEKDQEEDRQADKARVAQDLEVDAVGGMGLVRVVRRPRSARRTA